MMEPIINRATTHVNTSSQDRTKDITRAASELGGRLAVLAQIREDRVKEGRPLFWNWFWQMATEPSLSNSERWHAIILAAYADWETGENCLPARSDVSALTGLEERAIQSHMRKFKSLGMISTNTPGRGRPLTSRLLSPVVNRVAADCYPNKSLGSSGLPPYESLGSSGLPPYESLGGDLAHSLGGNPATSSLVLPQLPTHIRKIKKREELSLEGFQEDNHNQEGVGKPLPLRSGDRPLERAIARNDLPPGSARPPSSEASWAEKLRASGRAPGKYGPRDPFGMNPLNAKADADASWTSDGRLHVVNGFSAELSGILPDGSDLQTNLDAIAQYVPSYETGIGLVKAIRTQIVRRAESFKTKERQGRVLPEHRFSDTEKLPKVHYVSMMGRHGNQILSAVPGASRAAVEQSVEEAGVYLGKDVNIGQVKAFCIEWCQAWVEDQNAERIRTRQA